MFRDKANPLRRHRAVTLIEAVLYISIALALIVGGLVFFQQASTAAKTNTMVRQLSAVIAEARVLGNDMPSAFALDGTVTPFNIDSYLIAAGSVPADMVASATSLTNPFGGTTSFRYISYQAFGLGRMLFIDLSNVPRGVCARLLTAVAGVGTSWSGLEPSASGATTVVSSGYIRGGVEPTSFPVSYLSSFVMNPTQAGWMCKYGGSNYPTQTTEPNTAPLSGNVNVGMVFRI